MHTTRPKVNYGPAFLLERTTDHVLYATASKPSAIVPSARASRARKPKQLSSLAKQPTSITPGLGKYVRVLLSGSGFKTATCRVCRLHGSPVSKLTVQWLYLRRDLSTTVDPHLRSLLTKLSSREAFLTNHTDVILAESIARESGNVAVSIGSQGKKRKKSDADGGVEEELESEYRIVGFWKFDKGLLSGKGVEKLEDLNG
jgi:hypothetical protein